MRGRVCWDDEDCREIGGLFVMWSVRSMSFLLINFLMRKYYLANQISTASRF